MRPYQEEYIANIIKIEALTRWKPVGGLSPEDYEASLRQDESRARELASRNRELLREELFPTLDLLYQAGPEELRELTEFAEHLMAGKETHDQGLFHLIHQSLLSLARQKKDRDAVIRELYWMGMSSYWLYRKMVGLDLETIEKYVTRMRLYFTEAAAYLKYYDEIEDVETRGYILRSRANMSLGLFKSPSEKIGMSRETLRIMQDEAYHASTPQLPWDRFIYVTHQQMASSVSYSKEKVMTPEDMASVMESAYVVYHRRMQEAAEQKQILPLRWAFPYYAMEYYCGLYGLDRLLAKVERLLEIPEMDDYSPDGMYGILSLPAYYCQYLMQYPERIPEKTGYIAKLYQRALDYANACPAPANGSVSLAFRQLSFTFIDTEKVPFIQFLQMVLLRSAPEVYLHSWMVGTAAKALCGIILDEEPDFFDDMEEFRQAGGPAEKRRLILSEAMLGGLLHDVGKISFLELYSHNARQWFTEEYEATRLHVEAGRVLLSERESTRRFAPVALGHHAWYDGTSHGYPEAYRRLECSWRQMVDVIGLLDWLETVCHTAQIYSGEEMTFQEAVEHAVEMEGRQFSPLLTVRLRDGWVREQVWEAFEEGRREAYRHMYAQKRSQEEKESKKPYSSAPQNTGAQRM